MSSTKGPDPQQADALPLTFILSSVAADSSRLLQDEDFHSGHAIALVQDHDDHIGEEVSYGGLGKVRLTVRELAGGGAGGTERTESRRGPAATATAAAAAAPRRVPAQSAYKPLPATSSQCSRLGLGSQGPAALGRVAAQLADGVL